MSVFSKVLRVGEGKRLKELEALVPRVNALESSVEVLTDDGLRAKTANFASGSITGQPQTTSKRRPSRLSAKPRAAASGNATTTCR